MSFSLVLDGFVFIFFAGGQNFFGVCSAWFDLMLCFCNVLLIGSESFFGVDGFYGFLAEPARGAPEDSHRPHLQRRVQRAQRPVFELRCCFGFLGSGAILGRHRGGLRICSPIILALLMM